MSGFVLRKLILDAACGNKLKILEPGEYVLSDARYDAFYMEGLAIQAVVGKNGSGKSTLIEMLFRMSNNLAALMLRGYPRPAAERVYFIKGVVGEVVYEVDGVEGRLKCGEDFVELKLGSEGFRWSLNNADCEHRRNGQVVVERETRFQKEVKAAASFFYTIATNYSMQSYITDDYAGEPLLGWDEDESRWKNTHDATSWIDGVFHKNDGYMSPIVLNPYRHEGTVDMAKEERLTTGRLCALLWEMKDASDEEQLIEGYRLLDIGYDFFNWPLIQKFDKKMLAELPEGPFSSKFLWAYSQDHSIAKRILDAYGLVLDKKMSLVEQTLRIYLAYKTLSIAGKYPSYSHFEPVGDVNLAFQSKAEAYYHDLILGLVEKINGDNSHITLKIRQTRKLIDATLQPDYKQQLEGRFTYKEYIHMLGYPERVERVEERTELLPPPIFRPRALLVKNEVVNELTERVRDERARTRLLYGRAIDLNQLSSGERQFIYTTSTLVYHALNLKSVPEVERVAYKNICMVLDEIEICFHPEYQRTFVSKFVDLMRRTRLTEGFGINVLVITHSPFVLSDIPQGNILYLQEGHQLSKGELAAEEVTNPFCANINDILHQSFFLEKGFTGEFARRMVLSLADYLKGNEVTDHWTPEKARDFIKEIGEPLLREQLMEMYKESPVAGVRDKIALYEYEIERLRQEEG